MMKLSIPLTGLGSVTPSAISAASVNTHIYRPDKTLTSYHFFSLTIFGKSDSASKTKITITKNITRVHPFRKYSAYDFAVLGLVFLLFLFGFFPDYGGYQREDRQDQQKEGRIGRRRIEPLRMLGA